MSIPKMIDVMIAMCGKRLTGALRILLALIMEARDVKSLKTESCAVVEILEKIAELTEWSITRSPEFLRFSLRSRAVPHQFSQHYLRVRKGGIDSRLGCQT